MLAALLRIGWSIKRQSGAHRTLRRVGWPDFVFAFHETEEIGPRMLARIAKRTGLRPGGPLVESIMALSVRLGEEALVPPGKTSPRAKV